MQGVAVRGRVEQVRVLQEVLLVLHVSVLEEVEGHDLGDAPEGVVRGEEEYQQTFRFDCARQVACIGQQQVVERGCGRVGCGGGGAQFVHEGEEQVHVVASDRLHEGVLRQRGELGNAARRHEVEWEDVSRVAHERNHPVAEPHFPVEDGYLDLWVEHALVELVGLDQVSHDAVLAPLVEVAAHTHEVPVVDGMLVLRSSSSSSSSSGNDQREGPREYTALDGGRERAYFRR